MLPRMHASFCGFEAEYRPVLNSIRYLSVVSPDWIPIQKWHEVKSQNVQ
jgi:hypothetical protein